ncbi:MAG: glycosyltransferase, partial [bacterium]
MSRIDLTVVIVNYNVRPFLDHCLQSVERASSGLKVQTIVVDNASADDSVEMVKARYPDVILIENRENKGFARANNQAFELALGETVLILNPDSFVQEDTLHSLISCLESSEDIGAVGPKIIMPDGRFEPRSMRGFPNPWAAFSYLSGLSSLFPRSKFFSRYLLTYLDPELQHEVDALSGSCMMVRREVLRKLHGFDGDYFMYGEDLDLCYRIKQLGYRIIYNSKTRIVHFKGESTKRSDIDYRFHFQKAMRLFVDKHLAGSLSIVYRGIIALGFWFQSIEKKLIGFLQSVSIPVIDILLLNLFILLGRLIRFGTPAYDSGVWLVNMVYTFFYLASGLYFGVYGSKRFSGRYSFYAGITGAVLASAFTYFFRQWAFSRFVVLWFSVFMILAMPGWRILFRNWVRGKSSGVARKLIRRRALIVGTDELGRRIGQQLLSNGTGELDPVGYIDFYEDDAGHIIEGIPVLGGVKELDRIIEMEKVQELVFSTGNVSYERII